MNIEIIKSKKAWAACLSVMDNYDCYHTYDYHQLSKVPTDVAVLLKYEKDGVVIGLPFLIREINGSEFFDIISVYGYSGPVSKGITANFNVEDFKNALKRYFEDENIISVFMRLHPFIPHQNTILNGLGELTYLGKVVNIDLNLTLEVQRQHYHRRLKTQINKAYRECSLKLVETDADFDIFKNIYFENMNRVGATSFYFFDDAYFDAIRKATDFKTVTYLALEESTGKPIAGCMFFKTNNIIQYHLSGVSEPYMHLNGKKILIDHMRLVGKDAGFTYYNLGGGLGADETDSLFRFKSTFSKNHHQFYIWKLIVSQSKYDSLCAQHKVDTVNIKYFPSYRYKNN